MDETKQTAETGSEEGGDQRQQQIVDMGSSTIRTERGTIHTLTIVGQIEGHQVLPSSAKTTKYEHVMPLLAAIEEMGGRAFVTADHGNADRMTDEEGKPFTAHTTNPVPFIAVGFPEGTKLMPEGGRLADIAPTMLAALGLPQPAEMTGRSMLE